MFDDPPLSEFLLGIIKQIRNRVKVRKAGKEWFIESPFPSKPTETYKSRIIALEEASCHRIRHGFRIINEGFGGTEKYERIACDTYLTSHHPYRSWERDFIYGARRMFADHWSWIRVKGWRNPYLLLIASGEVIL